MAEDLADATASAVGGVITVAVTYPIEIVKNRIASAASAAVGPPGGAGGAARPDGRDGRDAPASAAAVARGILERRGVLGFYDGVTVSVFENAVEKFMYFYVYSALRRALQALRGGPSFVADLLAGSLAEIAHLPVSVPLETVLIKVVNSPQQGTIATAVAAVREKGVQELYAGTLASALLSAKPAVQLATFEWVRSWLLRRRGAGASALSAAQAFLLGALARAFATVVVFPYIRAKFMLKNMERAGAAADGDGVLAPLRGMHRAMALVVQRQGVGGLYQGLWQELARATTSAALLMAVRERLTLLIKAGLLSRRGAA